MLKYKIGDDVIVRKGQDKGAKGKILKISADGSRVLVDGVNIKTKHQKPNQSNEKPAGVYKEPRMISIANIGIPHPSKKSATARIGFSTSGSNQKIRINKANGKEVK